MRLGKPKNPLKKLFMKFSHCTPKNKKKGFNYEKENDLDGILASSFSFLETPDQKKAFQDVFKDMNSDIPMDRLISGDVGLENRSCYTCYV